MIDIFKELAQHFKPTNAKTKLHTNCGEFTAQEILEHLQYDSYFTQREYYGMTHEQLVKAGIGNDQFKIKYESENK